MNAIQSVLHSQDPISSDVLSNLGRKSLQEAFRDEPMQLTFLEIKCLWQRLRETACSPVIVDRHLTAASNAICVFLRYARQSKDPQVRDYVYSAQVWFEAFEVCHKAFSDGKNKPALQVLETLIQVNRENENREESTMILERAFSEMVEVIFTGEPKAQTKEACITLSCFLKKAHDIISFPECFGGSEPHVRLAFRQRCQQAHVDHQQDFLRETLGSFLMALLLTASISESRTAAIKLFSLLCSRGENIDFTHNVSIASSVIEVHLQSAQESLKDFTIDVFPSILSDTDQFHKFLHQFNPAQTFSTWRLSIFIAILQVGRQKNFVSETEHPLIIRSVLYDKLVLPTLSDSELSGLQSMLTCNDPTIRLQAFHLLTSSNTPTTPVPAKILNCYIRCLKHLHDDTDPSYRDEYTAICRRLVNRLEKSDLAEKRSQTLFKGFEANTSLIYVDFLWSWQSFLEIELSPQSSYQRHILGLNILHLTIGLASDFKTDPPHLIFSESLVMALLNLAFDAYDDVRSQATALLIKLVSQGGTVVASVLKRLQLVGLAKELSASTNRADHADALGRLLTLEAHTANWSGHVPKSQNAAQTINVLQDNVSELYIHLENIYSLSPSSRFHTHGSLLGVAYLIPVSFAQCKSLDLGVVNQIFGVCHRIWKLVQNQLCVDSPETETEDNEETGTEGPKDFLAYSWRALRDSSLVMKALIDAQLLDFSLHQFIGSLCLEQLIKLRHRGAFSTVAQTFTHCCNKVRSIHDHQGLDLNNQWLETAFNEINHQSSKLTRRSAGLPSIFAALLDPTDSKQFLANIERLACIARRPVRLEAQGELRLPQVHALNCLKDVMLNSRFRAVTEPLVVVMLDLSAKCISSKTWAIRNCGLMLFRSCINRLTPGSSVLYGAKPEHNNERKAQTPLAVGINLLKQQQCIDQTTDDVSDRSEANTIGSELIFAALDLLSRIPIQTDADKIVDNLVTAHLGSKLWTVRDHAARLKAERVRIKDCYSEIKSLLSLDPPASSNDYHGRLLCCRYMFQYCWQHWEMDDKKARSAEVISVFLNLTTHLNHYHPLVSATVWDIINDVLLCILAGNIFQDGVPNWLVDLQDVLNKQMTDSEFFSFRRAVALTQACLHICRFRASGVTGANCLWSDELFQNHLKQRDISLYLLNVLEDRISKTHSAGLLDFVLRHFSSHQTAEVESAVLKTVTTCMRWEQPVRTTEILSFLESKLDLRHVQNRDFWNAQICSSACMLRHGLQTSGVLNTNTLKQLVAAIRVSQQDKIEMPTRLNAVEAIAELTPLLATDDGVVAAHHRQSQLRLLLTLYDFLNDDDEDIRDLASTTTFRTIELNKGMQNILTACASSARQTLIEVIFDRFGQSSILLPYACMKVIGATLPSTTCESEHLETFCCTVPVNDTIGVELRRAVDLFAEERQNLYINEIAEVQTWAKVIEKQSLNGFSATIGQALMKWVEEGLRCLSELIERDSIMLDATIKDSHGQRRTIVHPLGVTYNSEILTIFVRVVTMARLLRLPLNTETRDLEVFMKRQDALGDQLSNFQCLCQSSRAHERVLAAIESSLSDHKFSAVSDT